MKPLEEVIKQLTLEIIEIEDEWGDADSIPYFAQILIERKQDMLNSLLQFRDSEDTTLTIQGETYYKEV